MMHKNLEYGLNPRESNHETYALMIEFSRNPPDNKISCNIPKGKILSFDNTQKLCKCEKKNFQYQFSFRHCTFFIEKNILETFFFQLSNECNMIGKIYVHVNHIYTK